MQTPYYTYKQYLKNRYNKALYSIPIDLDLGCPNRDSNGLGGCTFCPSNGARAAQTLSAKSIEEQIKKATQFAKNRYKATGFMLYIQAYTGTFTSVIKQKNLYSNLLKLYNFDAISIGTRPDCLNTKTLEYLKELNKQIDVHIDLGVQTLNDKSLKNINRGHDSNSSIQAIKKLKEYNIKVFAHIIIGLKDETRKDWQSCVEKLCALDVDGIKIHNLHIIKNTQLAKEFEKNNFKILDEYEYANEVINLLRYIPSHIPIIRISTDTLKEDLIAPIWNMQKSQFFDYVNEQMIYKGISQGDLVEKKDIYTFKLNSFKLQDGSYTFFDEIYKDYYHAKSGAYTQAKKLFIDNSKLKNKLKSKDINLLDIGFGMGYNLFEILKIKRENKLSITALDKNRIILKNTSKILENKKEKELINTIFETLKYKDENLDFELIIQEARYSMKKLQKKYDIVFLDSFVHNQNPSLLTFEFIQLIKKVLKKDGIIICSSNAKIVNKAFIENGFFVQNCNISKSDIKGIKAYFSEEKNEIIEQNSYKDEHLINKEKQIIINHQKN